MRNEERRKAARRRWYYRNRNSNVEPKPRVPDVPVLSAAERKEIRQVTVVLARAGRRAKSEELQRQREARKCLVCGGPVLVRSMKAKSCSKECAKIARRKNRNEWGKGCSHCSNPCRGKNKYCDNCNENRVYSRIQSTEEGKDSKSVRNFLLRTRGRECESCKLSEWFGNPIPLELHHVDGDSDNNKEDNVQILCPNCHALTPTFRNKNGRESSKNRRKRRKTREFASLA